MKSHSESYAAAGVDITAGYRAVELMKKHVARTRTSGAIDSLGGFGGVFAPPIEGMRKPLLVSGTDGVGTKLKLAFMLDKHNTVGIDCVAMCVNDVICAGAQPLFFLDYIACGKNVPERIEQIVAGVAEGCVQAGAALIGGETAEMPGFYATDEYDLAGFTVGLVDADDVLDREKVEVGDVVIGLASSGVHSNGFSLVRKVFANSDLDAQITDLESSLGETLLTPTKIYVKAGLALARAGAHAISHITGGGLYENLPRALPKNLGVRIDLAAIPHQPIFEIIEKTGNIPQRDMYNTFNMGLGLAAIVPADRVDAALAAVQETGETPFVIGEVTADPEVVLAK